LELFNIFIVVVLIAFTAFFVASEFAIVKIRSTRIDQLIAEGNKNAVVAKKIISNLDEYLSACQLGITITGLGLGWVGESTVEALLHPVFEKINISPYIVNLLSFGIAFAAITFLHVVVGELAPKTLAIQKAEAITLLTARPLAFFYKIMFPFIWALNGSSRIIIRLFGLKTASEHELAHSEEELRFILSESYKSGEINQSEYKYVNNIFTFDDRIAKEIMVPRTEIVALDKNKTIKENLEIIKEEKFTRYPVIDGDKDNVIGLINIKEVFTELATNGNLDTEKSIEEFVRPIIKVIESIPIHDLLVKMQKERIHMAILYDEYGGTSGLVTVEDILEEIVGEIQDEFDDDEKPIIQQINQDRTLVDGRILISEINDLLGLNIEEEDVDTLGGWMLTKRYDIQQGESIEYGPYIFLVAEMVENHIKKIEIIKSNKESLVAVEE
jgi:CBS domain containing-hemolysin-like protein